MGEAAVVEAGADRALARVWAAYRDAYIEADGRVVDRGHGGITTSEGQAYAMVRAVWVDDRGTFERVRAWTRDHLQGGDPLALPAWKWGEGEDGWGVLDRQPAADADQWMAWALIRAARRWGDTGATVQARGMLTRLWEEETQETPLGRVVLPGPWAKGASPLRVNPSYWLPFAWRDFAAVDPERPWMELVPVAYTLWDVCAQPSGLPPDWCSLDEAGRAVAPAIAADSDFGFEAFRVGWTLAAERRWHGEKRAKRPLRAFQELRGRIESEGRLPGVIAPDGQGRVPWEYQGMIGALVPAWSLESRAGAAAIARAHLPTELVGGAWGDPADYYGQNWIWFGYALLDLGEP